MGFGEHGRGSDAIEPGARLVDDQREPRGVQRNLLAAGERHMQRRVHSTRALAGCLPGTLPAFAPRDTAHRRARPCGARCASRPVRPGPERPRYERCGPRSSAVSARPPHRRSAAPRFSCTRREAAAAWPSTARNALVIATEILLASNLETVPLRRITCIGSAASGAASDSGRSRITGVALASRSSESDIGRPRGCCAGAGCLWGTLHRMHGANAGMKLQATAGHPARGRFGVAAGLLARRSSSPPCLPNARPHQ